MISWLNYFLHMNLVMYWYVKKAVQSSDRFFKTQMIFILNFKIQFHGWLLKVQFW